MPPILSDLCALCVLCGKNSDRFFSPPPAAFLRLALVLAALLLPPLALPAGVLLRTNFESADWPARSVSTSDPAILATAAYGQHGTIDTLTDVAANATDAPSKGLLLTVDSSATAGPWSAGLSSGVLTLTTANTTHTDLAFLTLSFSLRASRAHPVVIRLESYDSAGTTRTGGLRRLIHPAAPNYTQRFALDLSTFQPDGAGAFVPTATKIVLTLELDSAAGGDGWPAASGHTLRLDNVNYSTPAYYVGGPNAADNTTTGRGATAAAPFATVGYAVGRAAPGDIIVVRNGTYTGAVNFRKFVSSAFQPIAGAPDAWVVLKNYPGETPVIRHGTWGIITIGLGSTAAPHTGATPAYIELRGLTVRGYNTIDANGDRGLDPAVANPLLSKIGTGFGETNCNGIIVEGRRQTRIVHDIRVADCVLENNSGSGVSYHRADRVLVENNLVRNNSWWSTYGPSGISTLVPADVENNADYRSVIQGNRVFANETMTPWIGELKFSDGNGIIIDVNRNVDVGSNADPAYRARTLVQNNLVVNNGGSGIHAFNAQNTDIVHNTAYLNSASSRLQYSQIYAGYSKDVRMFGNIAVAPANPTGDPAFNEPVTSNSNNVAGTIYYQNNVYQGLGNNLALPSGSTFTPNVNANPLFVAPSRDFAAADFRLRSTSPARGAGPSIPFRSGLDVTGAPRPISLSTPDHGAYQTPANTVFPPVLSPAPGNHAAPASVTLASDTPGAAFVYTTDGTEPAVTVEGTPLNGTAYTGASIAISTTTTLRVVAWKSGLAASPVSGGHYTFQNLSAVPIPDLIFFPDGGTYANTTPVAIICRTPGAFVRYTTDGSTPTPTTGTIADSPMIEMTSRATLRAIAYHPGRANSAVKSATYTITGRLGHVSAGTVIEPLGANKIRFARFTAANSVTLANVYARVSGAGTYRVALYSDTAGAPSTRRATSTAVTNPADGWATFTFSTPYAITAGTAYWLAIWSDNAAANIYASTTGGTVREAASTLGGTGSWPSTAPATTASANGAYSLALYATPRNLAPAVAITAADAAVTLPAAVNLAATVSDDSIPTFPGAPALQWTRLSGPGTVTFSAPTSPATTASFSAAGDYVLRLTATDGSLSGFADVAIAVSGGGPGEQVLYRETFGNALASATPAVRFNAPSIGWSHYTAPDFVANVTDASATNGGSDYRAGRPADLANVNAGASDSAELGYAQSLNASRALVFTTEYTIDRSAFALTTLSWYSHLSATNSGQNNQSPAVRIAGQWYVIALSTAPAGNLTQTGSGGNFLDSGALVTVDFAAATATTHNGIVTSAWRQLTAAPGAPFSISETPVALPAGNLEAFGVFFTTAGPSTARFDTFEIRGTPIVRTPTTTSLASSLNPANLAAPVTFTATVAATSGTVTPSGTVTFLDGATPLGSVALNASGVSTLTTSSLAPGAHSITAAYAQTDTFAASTSATLTQTVLASTATPAGVARSTFTDGAGSLYPQQYPGSAGDGWAGPWSASAALTPAGSAAIPLAPAAGNYVTLARTSGTSTQEGLYRQWSDATRPYASFTRVTFLVRLDSSASVFNTASDNLSITTRSALGAGTGADSAAFLRAHGAATGPLAAREWGVYDGQPSVTTAFDAARFLPTGMLLEPGVAYAITLDLYAAATAGSTYGREHGTYDVTLTNTATNATVTVRGARFRSTSTLAGGVLAFSTQQSAATDNLAFSLDSIELTALVPLLPTTTELASSANPSAPDAPLTLTVTVSSDFGLPAGTVTFYDGTTLLGSAPLDGGGFATLITSSLTLGEHTLTAAYAGTATFEASASAALTQTIAPVLGPYETWRQSVFTPDQLNNPAISAPLADPDADGLANLLEYALASIPTDPTSASLPVLQVSGLSPPPFLQLTFHRIADPALLYEVLATDDLTAPTWDVIWSSTGAQNVHGPLTVSDEPPSSSPRRFLRLRVTLP